MIRNALEFTSYAIEIICGLIFDRIMNLLVNYLIRRDIPICKASLVEASKMYLDNKINDDLIIKMRVNPIVIPKI